MSVRTVLGKVQKLNREEHSRMKPDAGFDSVSLVFLFGIHPFLMSRCAQVQAQTPGKPVELVVYTADAIRPAYLIMLK
jgi:hypothetical protein